MGDSKTTSISDHKTRDFQVRALIHATLDAVEEAIVVLDAEGRVVVWNKAAELISGYRRADRIGHLLPEDWLHQDEEMAPTGVHGSSGKGHFYTGSPSIAPDLEDADAMPPHALPIRTTRTPSMPMGNSADDHAIRMQMRHAQGHTVPIMMRQQLLRDTLGSRIGACLQFYPSEEMDRLPHGETGDSAQVSQAQDEMQDWLEETYRSAVSSTIPFGLLWISVDQGKSLRRTHGMDATEEMMKAVERALRHGLRPSEMLGRWGECEFLVISHERSLQLLLNHAHQLAGLARTANFRWWGDRIGLTLSIGAAQWQAGVTLAQMLEQAQSAMRASEFAGGNQVSRAHADGSAGA